MSIQSDFEKDLQEATDKCIGLMSEFLEAGIIIGTYRDENGETQKWSQHWGNEFAVTKITEIQCQEDQIMNSICLSEHNED